MSRLVYGETERMLQWAAGRFDFGTPPADTQAIGLEGEGGLKVVAFFNNFSSTNCDIHVVTDGSRAWATRGFLAAVFAYPFIQCGLRRVTAYVAADNTAALEMDLRLGFQREGVMREGADTGDMMILGMLKNECKWLPEGLPHG